MWLLCTPPCRYDLYGVEITPKSEYSPNTMGYTYYAESGYHYVTVPMDELLFEGGQSVRSAQLIVYIYGVDA